MARSKLKVQRSALEDHTQVRKELVPPFQRIGPPPEQIFWPRDLLPEFLWIDALVQEYGRSEGNKVLNEFLALADGFNTHPKEILDGTVGAFRLIPKNRRRTFVKKLSVNIDRAVTRPFGHVLSLYRECPMSWMAEASALDRDSAIGKVREAVIRLFPGKDDYAGFCRALPLSRFFVHHKIMIAETLKETIEAIKAYPHGDRYRAETFARTTHSSFFMHRAKENPDTFAWAHSFWNANLSIVKCDL